MIVGSGIALGGISWMMLLVSATVGNIQADQAERTLVKDKAHVSAFVPIQQWRNRSFVVQAFTRPDWSQKRNATTFF